MTDLLIDPDCRDGKCSSCTGGACEHDCHATITVSQMVYQHPVYGTLAVASLGATVPPTWTVEAVGACAHVVDSVRGVERSDAATNVLARMGETLTVYCRAANAALGEARAAMRVAANVPGQS